MKILAADLSARWQRCQLLGVGHSPYSGHPIEVKCCGRFQAWGPGVKPSPIQWSIKKATL